jgi:hypothetical protein
MCRRIMSEFNLKKKTRISEISLKHSAKCLKNCCALRVLCACVKMIQCESNHVAI